MHRAMGTELESYNVQMKYNKAGREDRLKMIAYERVSFLLSENPCKY